MKTLKAFKIKPNVIYMKNSRDQMLMMTAAEMYEFIDALLTAHGNDIPMGFTFQINGEQRVVLYYAENDEPVSKEPLRRRSYS